VEALLPRIGEEVRGMVCRVSVLVCVLGAAHADMLDVLSPTMVPPAQCPNGCDSWTSRKSGALWASGAVPPTADSACAQPAKASDKHPYGSWCFCAPEGNLSLPAPTHPLDQKTFQMLNRFPGESDYVSFAFTDAPPSMPGSQEWMRATYSKQTDSMPLTFNAVKGQPNVYTLQNKFAGYAQWVQYSDDDNAWIHAHEADSQVAMRIEFVLQSGSTDTYTMICRGKYGSGDKGCTGLYLPTGPSGCV
jgi:hypothetical protein